MSTSRGITVKDVPAADFVVAYAKHLKRGGRVEVPKWADMVKTGIHKQLAPYDPDWYFVRCAAVARRIYVHGGLGVGDFRRIYGGAKNNGVAPSHFKKGSGAVARSVLKQLERLQVLEKDPKGGRKMTFSGQRDLDRIAGQLHKGATKKQ